MGIKVTFLKSLLLLFHIIDYLHLNWFKSLNHSQGALPLPPGNNRKH